MVGNADGGPFGEVDKDIDDTRLLVGKMALAVHLLLLKKKLRALEVTPAGGRASEAA